MRSIYNYLYLSVIQTKAVIMNSKKLAYILLSVFLFSAHLGAQDKGQEALNSITAAELRDHIFFLASDYLNGRVGPTAEYEIAAQYVATQFAAAEIEPVHTQDGNRSFFQDVPFVKTVYDDKLKWKLDINGTDRQLVHREDFKIVYGSKLNFEKTPLVWAGYGIEEPEHKWNDFKDLDTEGKIIVFMTGAPVKKDKPVLPGEIHRKYNGQRGFQTKISRLFSKGAAGIIMVDTENSGPMSFDAVTSRFNTETFEYKNSEQGSRRSRPAVFVVKPGFIDIVMGDKPYNPMKDDSGRLKNYQPQIIKDVQISSSTEMLSQETINTKNVVGMVPGTDPVLKNEYIVVGAHLDHVKPRNGQVCNGADDNASGSAGVIEIAEAVAMNPGKRTVVFVTFTAEEMGLVGSRHFVNSGLFPKEQMKFNINMDMIGRSDPDNEETRAHWAVTHKKYVNALRQFINDTNQDITDFPIIVNNDEDSPGGSDHQSFIREGIPGFFFFSGVHNDLHNPGDDPEKIDYPKAESISRLAYMMAVRLANMEAVPSFE